jgi:hypothetical protein
MDIDENLHRPEESGSADVTLLARGITVTASVDVSSTGLVVVRPATDRPLGEIQTGDRVELYWVGGHEERTLGGIVSSIEDGPEPRWHIAVSGMAERSQRRKAVRARVAVDVLIPWAGGQMAGTTVDLSEGGMRALIDGWGLPPEPDTLSQVSLTMDDALLHLQSRIVWTSIRGAQWLLAMQFREVPENAADRLRRRVFRALREERAAAAG